MKYRLIRFALWSALLLTVSGVLFFLHLKHVGTEQYQAAMKRAPYDAVVVPGLPYGENSWTELIKMRVLWAVYLYEENIADHIIFSGSAVYTPYTECEIMKAYAIAVGVPEEKILLENQAEHSTENLYYGYKLAEQHQFKNVAVATDPFQAYFLRHFAERHEIDISFLPLKRALLRNLEMPLPEIDTTQAYVHNFIPLPEREGFFQRFSGTLGNNISNLQNEE